MRGRLTSIVALSVAGALLLGVSQASGGPTLTFTASMTGSQEVPPVVSSATGFASISWDTTTNQMTLSVTFSGLGSSDTVAAIHCCAPAGSTAGAATPIPSLPGFPLGVTSGTFTGSFDMTSDASYNPAFLSANGGTAATAAAALLAGLAGGNAYFNIHTANLPGGEIRGQLQTPTAVQLLRFTAAGAGKSVRLRWRTASEAGTLGFKVYRGRVGARTLVSRKLIPARGGVGGAAYSWRDRRRGKSSLYWLQIVRMDGSRSWYGPARVR